MRGGSALMSSEPGRASPLGAPSSEPDTPLLSPALPSAIHCTSSGCRAAPLADPGPNPLHTSLVTPLCSCKCPPCGEHSLPPSSAGPPFAIAALWTSNVKFTSLRDENPSEGAQR